MEMSKFYIYLGKAKNKKGPEKQTGQARKNKYELSAELACLRPEKKQMPQRKKGAARQPEREKAFWARPPGFFSSGQAVHPGSAQEVVRPSVRKKTGPEKQAADARKNKSAFVFFKRQSDGKPTIKFTFPKLPPPYLA